MNRSDDGQISIATDNFPATPSSSLSSLDIRMSLAAYLAKNYLTAEEPTKKKKRKRNSNLDIIDDTPSQPLPSSPRDHEDKTIDPEALIVGETIQDRKHIPHEQRWKTAVKFEEVDRPDEQPTLTMDAETEAALQMESGARAGLQTAAEVNAAIARKQKRELEEFQKSKMSGKELETTYRDATGRRMDPILRRAELRFQQEQKEREEREAKEAEERRQKELRLGLAQRREQEEQKEKLKGQEMQKFANTRDDEEYNETLKAQERWNDPAAAFLSVESKKKKSKGFKSTVPVYMGVVPPNRFKIRPGYRWDGVWSFFYWLILG
jgi:pre-mRNA-splicing factor CWC26